MQGIYHSPTLGLISLVDGDTVITIADKNLGATTVYNDGDTLSEANCGGYFQWGNNYMFPWTGDITTSSTKVNVSSYGPGNYYSSGTFITASVVQGGDWASSRNDNLWGGTTGTNEAMQGPCPNGFHIPSKDDYQSIYDIGVNLGAWSEREGDNFRIMTKMPFTGTRTTLGTLSSQGDGGFYWSSTAAPSLFLPGGGYCLNIGPLGIGWQEELGRAYGQSIRPFKNEPVMPDKKWIALYGDEIKTPIIIHGAVGTRKAIQTITPPWAPKDKTELEALGSLETILDELNSHKQEYYDFFLEGTTEGLEYWVDYGIYDGGCYWNPYWSGCLSYMNGEWINWNPGPC